MSTIEVGFKCITILSCQRFSVYFKKLQLQVTMVLSNFVGVNVSIGNLLLLNSFQIMSKSIQKDSSETQYQADIWATIHNNLTDLSSEYKSPSAHFQIVSKQASDASSMPYRIFYKENLEKPLQMLSQEARREPRGEKIRVLKGSAEVKKSKAVGEGGVNHLNLIQIKGNPAHSWQPRVQSPEEKGKVFRPDLTSLQMNSLLLKIANTNSK